MAAMGMMGGGNPMMGGHPMMNAMGMGQNPMGMPGGGDFMGAYALPFVVLVLSVLHPSLSGCCSLVLSSCPLKSNRDCCDCVGFCL